MFFLTIINEKTRFTKYKTNYNSIVINISTKYTVINLIIEIKTKLYGFHRIVIKHESLKYHIFLSLQY